MPARPHLLTLLFHDVFIGLSLRQTGGEVTVRYYCAAVIRNSILLLVWVKSVDNWELVAFTLNTVCPTQFFSVFFGGRVGGVFYFLTSCISAAGPFFTLCEGVIWFFSPSILALTEDTLMICFLILGSQIFLIIFQCDWLRLVLHI